MVDLIKDIQIFPTEDERSLLRRLADKTEPHPLDILSEASVFGKTKLGVTILQRDEIIRDREEDPSNFMIVRYRKDCAIERLFGNKVPPLDVFNKEFSELGLCSGSVLVHSFSKRGTSERQNVFQTQIDYSNTQNVIESLYCATRLTFKALEEISERARILLYLMTTTRQDGLDDTLSAKVILKARRDHLIERYNLDPANPLPLFDPLITLRVKKPEARVSVQSVYDKELYTDLKIDKVPAGQLVFSPRPQEAENKINGPYQLVKIRPSQPL